MGFVEGCLIGVIIIVDSINYLVDDVISNDPRELSTFTLQGFSPSEGVVIKVISREPFIIFSKHYDVDVGFQYNFELGVIKKIGGQNAEHTQ